MALQRQVRIGLALARSDPETKRHVEIGDLVYIRARMRRNDLGKRCWSCRQAI